jgi:hypothetical protein
LTRHLAFIHNIDVKWHPCPEDGCKYKAKENSHLKTHLAHIHNINVKWHPCPEDGCKYKAKENSHLKKHLANIHNINVKWYHCPEDGCKYKSKDNGTLTRHLADVHDIDVKWYHCPEDGCDFKTKHNSHLKRHQLTCMGNGVGSNGEKYIKQCLSDLGFLLDEDYVYDRSYVPLSNFAGKQLRFDFRFLEYDIAIEYDGRQHFEPVNFGGITNEQVEERFKEIQNNDKLKNDFCKENNFQLIRIPYTRFAETLSILSVELSDIIDWIG